MAIIVILMEKLTPTPAGASEFVQLSPALFYFIFFTRPVDVFPLVP